MIDRIWTAKAFIEFWCKIQWWEEYSFYLYSLFIYAYSYLYLWKTLERLKELIWTLNGIFKKRYEIFFTPCTWMLIINLMHKDQSIKAKRFVCLAHIVFWMQSNCNGSVQGASLCEWLNCIIQWRYHLWMKRRSEAACVPVYIYFVCANATHTKVPFQFVNKTKIIGSTRKYHFSFSTTTTTPFFSVQPDGPKEWGKKCTLLI